MSNKKHIDRVFQEKLKDFELSPSPKVWKNIKDELKQSDDDEKVFPIWFRLAGVAVLLLLLFTIGNVIVSNTGDSNNTIVDTENTTNTSDNQPDDLNNNNHVEDNQNASQDAILSDVNSSNLNSESNSEVINNSGVTETNPSEINTNSLNNNNVAESNSSNKTNTSEDKNNNSAITTKTPKRNKTHTNAVTQQNNVDATSQPTHVVAQNISPLNKSSEKANNGNVQNKSNNSAVSSTPTTKESVAQNNSENQNNNANTISQFDNDKVNAAINNKTKDALAENQSNREELENTKTDEETEEDSPSIEEAIALAEDLIEEEDEEVDKWQVYANVAPVYYNTLGKGSHIDDQFVGNSKSGEINASYGVNVSYVLNKKLKLRSGVNSLKLSYDTDNVILFENVDGNNSAALRNITLIDSMAVSAISANNLGVQQALGLLPNENAAISQRIGYYEVPVELEYTLSDKKLGVNVIAGFSTFFLNDNKIYSEFEGRKTHIGEANNINDVSFSGNLGLGLDYKFSDKIKFNVQPTFKYQMSAYKNTSGNFRPYIVGVYTGLSYTF